MRVLAITNLYPPVSLGGYEMACANVCRELLARGHQVKVLTGRSHLPVMGGAPDEAHVSRVMDLNWYLPHLPGNAYIFNREVHRSHISSLANTAILHDEIGRFRPDVVYVWNMIGLGGVGLLDLLNTIRMPWVLHLMDRTPADLLHNCAPSDQAVFDAAGPQLYRDARVIAISRHILEDIRDACGIDLLDRADIVPAWADASGAPAHKPFLRDGIARFVTACAILPHKGVDLILEAAASLHGSGVRFLVNLYGDGDVGGYAAKSDAMGLSSVVSFKGQRPQGELMSLYGDYDAFLFPTWRREPQAFAPVEAMACGTPPVVTRDCGNAERLVDGLDCLKIDRTAAALEQAMRRICAGEIDLARMSRSGRGLVARKLTLSHGVSAIERILADHVAACGGAPVGHPKAMLLAYMKHNLAVRLRYG
jgi:glycogen synthase